MQSPPPPASQFHIVAAIGEKEHYWSLLSVGYAIAKAHGGTLTLLSVSPTETTPKWLAVPAAYQDLPIDIDVLVSADISVSIIGYTKHSRPELLLVGWRRTETNNGYRLRGTLDTLFRQATCNMAVVRADPTFPQTSFDKNPTLSILVPMAGGPNAPLAIEMALNLSSNATVTVLHLAPTHTDTADFMEHQQHLAQLTSHWADIPRFSAKIIRAESVFKGILSEAEVHDVTMLGASAEGIFDQIIFGILPEKIGLQNPHTTIIVKRFDGSVGGAFDRWWWRITHVLPILPVEERAEVYKQIRRGARPDIDFFVMIALASAIAALGLLLNSPAVIIGAMLVAPLMSAILGMGLGSIQADTKLLELAASATARGVLLAIVVGFVTKLIVPTNGDPTAEIVARTAPSLLDLGVAIFSGLAGAYALSRKDMSSSLPGVAIAAALVPPLATVGIGVAWLRWDVAGGAMLLFFTNLIAIIAASGLIFFLLGFRPQHRKQRTRIFRRAVISSTILLGLMIWVLSSLTIQSYKQNTQKQKIAAVLKQEISTMPGNVLLENWHIVSREPNGVKLEVSIRAPIIPSHQQAVALQQNVTAALGYPVALTLVSVRTTTLNPLVPPTPTATVAPGDTATATPPTRPTASAAPTQSP